MNQFKQAGASKRVLIIFGALCIILVALGGVLFFSLVSIEHDNQAQQTHSLDSLALVDDYAQDIGQIQVELLRQLVTADPSEVVRLDQAIRGLERTNAVEMAAYKKFMTTEKEKRQYEGVMTVRKAFWNQTLPVLALARNHQTAEARKLVNARQAPAYDALVNALNDLIDTVEAGCADTSRHTARFISRIRIISDALVGLTILILVGAGFSISGLTRQLKRDNDLLLAEVNERKAAQEALGGKTAFFEAQVYSSLDGILIVDQDAKRLLHNHRFVELFNLPPSVATDEGDKKRLHWVSTQMKDPEHFLRTVRHLYANPQEISRDELEAKDGKIIERLSSPVIGQDGKYYGRIWTFRDVTARKRLEAQMYQSQKLETVGKLAGGVAHEFNSILTAIIGQSEIILGDLPAHDPSAKNIKEIHEAARRAAALTQQLLAYGRKQILRPEALDLNQVLLEMEGTLRHLVGRNVDVRVISSPNLKHVKMDRSQIDQVIVNIAMNAAAAMPNGGQLTLETGNVTLGSEYVSQFPGLKTGDYVMLAMTDTGTGISPEAKKHLFEPFFSTKDVGQGAGLGLATCYGILKQSGGHINAYSEIGRGSTFKIYLPQAGPFPASPATPAATTELPRGTETILLAEDDPSLREMASSLLARLGYNVIAACDGVEALALKHQKDVGHVDLVFTDVVMPHMSGKELADRFRTLYPQTKVLFTSAYTENAIVHQGVLDPGVALLQKPFTPSALARRVRDILDGKPA
jgi:signal transduction histidine kinase/CheY-like chemotaxis protein